MTYRLTNPIVLIPNYSPTWNLDTENTYRQYKGLYEYGLEVATEYILNSDTQDIERQYGNVFDSVYHTLEAALDDGSETLDKTYDTIFEVCNVVCDELPTLAAHLEPYRQLFQQDDPDDLVAVQMTRLGLLAQRP